MTQRSSAAPQRGAIKPGLIATILSESSGVGAGPAGLAALYCSQWSAAMLDSIPYVWLSGVGSRSGEEYCCASTSAMENSKITGKYQASGTKCIESHSGEEYCSSTVTWSVYPGAAGPLLNTEKNMICAHNQNVFVVTFCCGNRNIRLSQ